jgi:hypothetical protein
VNLIDQRALVAQVKLAGRTVIKEVLILVGRPKPALLWYLQGDRETTGRDENV